MLGMFLKYLIFYIEVNFNYLLLKFIIFQHLKSSVLATIARPRKKLIYVRLKI